MCSSKIQQVFSNGWDGYCRHFQPSEQQEKAAYCIMNCKSGAFGYNISRCGECGCLEFHANSCRNRNCPNCQAVLKELWIDRRRSELIDADYFHVVFTIPAQLRPLVYANQKLLYALLNSASNTRDHPGPAYLGAGVKLPSPYTLYCIRRRAD